MAVVPHGYRRPTLVSGTRLGGQLKHALQIESHAHQIPFPFHLVETPQQKLPKPQHVLDDPKGRFDGGFPFRIQRVAGFRTQPVSHLGHRIVSRGRIRRPASSVPQARHGEVPDAWMDTGCWATREVS